MPPEAAARVPETHFADTRVVDEARLQAFVEKAVGEFGAALSAACVSLGDRLGFFKAMAHAGALWPKELAAKTGTTERLVREWLVNQAASGNVLYDPSSGKFALPQEHALALADDASPYFVAGGYQIVTALVKAEERIADAFKNGGGMFWGEHDDGLFEGTERFFRPNYVANLVSSWIPALDGVEEKLKAGAVVADVGCGHGASTLLMARAFPKSRFFGFDNHAPSITHARRSADEAGLFTQATFEVAPAVSFPGHRYDLITYFDCLHDMGDPLGALRHAHEALAPEGTVLLVEPQAGEKVEENLNPVGLVYSGASVLCCAPNAIASGNVVLGTIATEAEFRRLATAAGFKRFRRAAQTPFNRVFELRIS